MSQLFTNEIYVVTGVRNSGFKWDWWCGWLVECRSGEKIL